MTPVFADTSYYVALLSPRDQHHHSALEISNTLRRPIVVSEYVLIELTNALAAVESRGDAVALWRHLQNDQSVAAIIPASAELVSQGLDFYALRPDKQWSLTDCTSFVVMEELGITEALTADHHFEQAGFNALLN